jgi:GNAT superfamily N-acetyltransferase
VLAKLRPSHRAKVASLLADTPEFTAAEVAVALELVDLALIDPAGAGYWFLVCEEGESLLGYACFGPTPMTEACFDLYWLVVDRRARQKGIARQLLSSVERDVERAGGRMVRVETAGLELYRPARTLYERTGYLIAGHIRGFYAPGNDLFVFLKYLEPTPPGPPPA